MAIGLPFDPIRRSQQAEEAVMRGDRRLYYKFRAAPYYGGIATADAVGCSFLCAYCWNYGRNENPERFGKLYTPGEVAGTLLEISRRRNFHLFRITGSEPILGEASFEHLVKVAGIVLQGCPQANFILETNGLMLGYRKDLSEKLSIGNLLVRIALKGVTPASFERITGARSEFFVYPLLAASYLESRGARAWPALMEDLFSEEEIEGLKKTLRERGIRSELELERLEPYPSVLANMSRRGVLRRETAV